MPGYRYRNPRSCQGRQRKGLRLILEPSLLILLSEGESYGYELCDQLISFGVDMNELDSSVVYRDLREMEEKGYIDSYWNDQSKGPKRRVYRIRDLGKIRLSECLEVLSGFRDQVDQINKRYQTI